MCCIHAFVSVEGGGRASWQRHWFLLASELCMACYVCCVLAPACACMWEEHADGRRMQAMSYYKCKHLIG